MNEEQKKKRIHSMLVLSMLEALTGISVEDTIKNGLPQVLKDIKIPDLYQEGLDEVIEVAEKAFEDKE